VSSGQRILILVVAAVILIGGFVLAQGSSDDDEDDAAQTTQPAPASTVGETGPQEPENPAATAPATTEAAPPPPRVETVPIEGGGPVGDPKTLEYDSGETVRLRFTSDAAAEVHIHGYDKVLAVPADGSARTRFKANAEGIFEIEEHGTGELLAKLQVNP
jgi:hypothetical protein